MLWYFCLPGHPVKLEAFFKQTGIAHKRVRGELTLYSYIHWILSYFSWNQERPTFSFFIIFSHFFFFLIFRSLHLSPPVLCLTLGLSHSSQISTKNFPFSSHFRMVKLNLWSSDFSIWKSDWWKESSTNNLQFVDLKTTF